VIALVEAHMRRAHAETAPGSAHALDVSGLRDPAIRFWTLRAEGAPVGCAALKRLSADHGEVKSMHVVAALRGQGAGGRLLDAVIAAARACDLRRLSLETGVAPYFAPAAALYRSRGFVACPPFEGYRDDPNSLFMTRRL
jgi:putative acetyltransferase